MKNDDSALLVCESCPLMGGGMVLNHGRINPIVLRHCDVMGSMLMDEGLGCSINMGFKSAQDNLRKAQEEFEIAEVMLKTRDEFLDKKRNGEIAKDEHRFVKEGCFTVRMRGADVLK